MIGQTKQIYEFGAFTLIPQERQLLRDGQSVPLPPKAFDLLLALVEHSGHLMEKDDLLKKVWPDTFVEEANLSVKLSALRRALGEAPGDDHYIETVPKRGYRFVATVKETWDDGLELVVKREGAGVLSEDRDKDEDEEREDQSQNRGCSESKFPSPDPESRRRSRVGWKSRILNVRALAVILVVAGAAAVISPRILPARKAPLTEQDAILIADFKNTTGDSVFDDSLKQALAMQLEQSPFLSIFSEERVRETLRLMGRSPGDRLTKDIAREICERQGIKAMLTGSIEPLGRHYVINLEVTNAHDGDVIARQQVEAESKEKILQELGKSTSRLRQKLGESLSSIQKFDVPLEQVTTSSLEALKAYSVARSRMDLAAVFTAATGWQEAAQLLERAVELDPNFASAYADLARAYGYGPVWHPKLAAEAAQKAFDLRDRVSERERFAISMAYYRSVDYDYEKSLEVAQLWTQTYPRDARGHRYLGEEYADHYGQFEKAIEEDRESIRLDSGFLGQRCSNSYYLTRLNRFDEASKACECAELQGDRGFHDWYYQIAFARGDAAAMQREIELANGTPAEYENFASQAQEAVFLGESSKAREFYRRAISLAESRDAIDDAQNYVGEEAWTEAVFGYRERARKAASSIHTSDLYPPLYYAALALALSGEVQEAESRASELRQLYPRATKLTWFYLPEIQAAIEIERGDPEKALEALEISKPYEGAQWFGQNYLRGQAYLLKGSAVEAAAEFQKILDHRGWQIWSPLYPLARLGLGRAAALAGDKVKARKAYEDFFDVWKNADTDIPILRQARREYESLK